MRRWRYLLARRGAIRGRPWFPPPVAQLLPPEPGQQAGPRPRVAPLPRRGKFLAIPPAVPLVPPPWVAQVVRRRRPVLPVRRGEPFFPAPTISSPPVPAPRRTRGAGLPARRGDVFAFVPTTVQAGPGPLPPALRASRQWPGWPVRRGDFQDVPRAGVQAGPGPLPPKVARPVRRVQLSGRGGRLFAPPWAPQAPVAPQVPPDLIRRAGAATAAARRAGRFTPVVPAQDLSSVGRATSRRPVPGLIRRGRIWVFAALSSTGSVSASTASVIIATAQRIDSASVSTASGSSVAATAVRVDAAAVAASSGSAVTTTAVRVDTAQVVASSGSVLVVTATATTPPPATGGSMHPAVTSVAQMHPAIVTGSTMRPANTTGPRMRPST